MGSESDWPVMRKSTEVLERLGIDFEVRVSSAHRTPAATAAYVADAGERGCAAFICGAGMAAHLAGAVAAHTVRPVIGVPIDSGPLQGFDALLATVQMPGGIPVATVAVGSAGARNAAYLAAQILALNDAQLATALAADREENQAKVRAQNERLQAELSENQ
ncbi:MAG: 5-(carboxyamino)imidazole ribonucleotide mutase [Gammaproteobacteria bacterium]|nr:5-(carboxyamino)imidazole ribonucleotide mutase [Gammaproteobacteria bacterium]MDE0271558.1 5-(carboxyamino)imidazole ribonucleotide mutase [Gammaproteobacteria bacterium]